jgi:hypothetical protein
VDDFHKLGLPGLHVLVNNAGVHLMVSGDFQTLRMVTVGAP